MRKHGGFFFLSPGGTLARPGPQTWPANQGRCVTELGQIPIFVINLARSTDRRARMQSRLASMGLPARFVDAVDGNRLTAEQSRHYDARRARRVYGSEMTPGEIGCCLSHLLVLKHIVDSRLPHALVLEDDLVFEAAFPRVIADLVALPEGSWQVVRLNVLKGPILAPRTSRDIGIEVARLQDGTLFRVNRNPLGAGAYLVTMAGASAILRHADPVFMPFDHMLDRFWENGILPYVVRPSTVQQDGALESDIGCRGTAVARSFNPVQYVAKRVQRVLDSVRKRLFLQRLNRARFSANL